MSFEGFRLRLSHFHESTSWSECSKCPGLSLKMAGAVRSVAGFSLIAFFSGGVADLPGAVTRG